MSGLLEKAKNNFARQKEAAHKESEEKHRAEQQQVRFGLSPIYCDLSTGRLCFTALRLTLLTQVKAAGHSDEKDPENIVLKDSKEDPGEEERRPPTPLDSQGQPVEQGGGGGGRNVQSGVQSGGGGGGQGQEGQLEGAQSGIDRWLSRSLSLLFAARY